MREPREWEEQDIETLIREQRQEDLQLEYKRSDALAKTDPKRTEISKDVSAMANSAGGVIVYGVDEQKARNGPIRLDDGIDQNEYPTEWLEQVIDSRIQRRIEGVKVQPVRMSSNGRHVYVVSVPQSNRAPHMAADHRYHKRLGTTTARMEEYEVRDVGRRSESPDLYIGISVRERSPTSVALFPRVGNLSPEPAFHVICRFYVDLSLEIRLRPNLMWSRFDNAELLWNNRDVAEFQVLRFPWRFPSPTQSWRVRNIQ
jgi:hypothetical protein